MTEREWRRLLRPEPMSDKDDRWQRAREARAAWRAATLGLFLALGGSIESVPVTADPQPPRPVRR